MSVEKLIVDHMETWTSALQTRSTAGRGSSGKIDLYGIKKLRELILELAVRGKLVPQDPHDEPASELLKRIAAEKAELVKQGKIKKQKPLPEISEEEKPFELPQGWEWVTLATVGEIVGGGTPKSDNPQFWAKNGIKWITPADLYGLKGKYITSGARDISPAGLSTNQGFKSCVPYIKESAEYIYYFLLASAKKIDAEASGTTFKEVSGAIVSKILLPLPPLSEQLKIVSRANELMSLCDQLEQQSLTSLDAHQQLVETLLGTLTDSQNAEELAENWTRISEHFDTLFTTEASVDALKQTILQLAVMGKLVPQDPNDEPASELLKRIAQEKAQLVKEGKIKKQKPLPPISDEEKPFELPEGWEWCRLGNILQDIKYGTSQKCNYKIKGVPVLRIPNIVKGFIELDDIKYGELTDTELEDLKLKKNDLLIIRSNGSTNIVGKSTLVESNLNNYAYAGYIIRVRLHNNFIHAHYINAIMSSCLVRSQIEGPIRTTTGVKNINSNELMGLLIPLPPLNQQITIIDKLDETHRFISKLKNLTQSAQQTQLHLADALTDAAIN